MCFPLASDILNHRSTGTFSSPFFVSLFYLSIGMYTHKERGDVLRVLAKHKICEINNPSFPSMEISFLHYLIWSSIAVCEYD